MKKILIFLLTIVFSISSFSQVPEATPADKRLKGYEIRMDLKENSLIKNVQFRNVGPVVMSGRVVDLDVNPKNPNEFYAAYASGGLWHTNNNGITFTPIFDNRAVMTLGDIAVDWKNRVIWAGTGENNSSRSSYSGTGLYKSADNGKTWEFMGLPETHHTGRIIMHPENPDILWVAAIGHLYSPNEERGVYKTTDGGKNWKKTLFIDENTGVIDLVINPQNPDHLYAAAWTRERRAWNFVEGGEGSGIYESTDGGDTWTKISGGKSGFPDGEGVGRIGLAIYPDNPQIMYAFLDNNFHREKEEKEETDELTKEQLKLMSKEDFLELSEDKLQKYLKDNSFPRDYTVKIVKEMVKNDEI
ncbi:MAG: WD40/YVTN/BNR-like repeat-containing protein, partial [Bacteroidales bacterium]